MPPVVVCGGGPMEGKGWEGGVEVVVSIVVNKLYTI